MPDRMNFEKWEPLLAVPLLREFEGFEPNAYLCPAGVWTIGYGHTGGVRKGEHISLADAEKLLSADLERIRAKVAPMFKRPVTRYQFIALMSFIYNIGVNAFKASTLLLLMNANRDDEAVKQFSRWRFANGKELPGLVKRRAREAEVFQYR